MKGVGNSVMNYKTMKVNVVGVNSRGSTCKAHKAGIARLAQRWCYSTKKDHWPRPGDTIPPQNNLTVKRQWT